MSPTLNRVRQPVISWWMSQSSFNSDGILYLASGVFALILGFTSGEPAQWHWGYLTFAVYFAAAILMFLFARSRWANSFSLRKYILLFLVVGVVIIPLGLEAHWRQNNSTLAQPEVSVIERAANNVINGKDPYSAYVKDGKLHNQIKGVPSYESFYPYGVFLSIFGIPEAISHKGYGLTDARLVMTLLTIVVGLIALRLLRSSREKKLRVAQVLIALPTGALFLCTGGDDMPVLALMLLGVVALQRKQTYVAAVSIGLAAAMKLTAWPMALGSMIVVRDEKHFGKWKQFFIVSSLIVIVTILPFAIKAPHTFITNVFSFPFGLSGINSPAASALPGHILATFWSPSKHILPATTLIIGGAFMTRYLRTHWPLTLSKMLSLLGTCFLVLICVSSATRFGYCIYFVNVWVWSWATREDEHLN